MSTCCRWVHAEGRHTINYGGKPGSAEVTEARSDAQRIRDGAVEIRAPVADPQGTCLCALQHGICAVYA